MDGRLPPGHFFGSLRQRRDLAGLVLTEYHYPPALRAHAHAHALPYFCVVLEGHYTETARTRVRTHEPSTVTFHPAGEEHADRFHAAGARIFSVEVEPRWLERIEEPDVLGRAMEGDAGCFRGGPIASLALRIHREFVRMDSVSRLAIEGLSLELLAHAWRRRAPASSSPPPAWLRRARELAHEQCCEPLTLAAIATEVGVHPMHLVREFRRHFRQTVGDYVRHQRIERACRRLRESADPISAIAVELGFSQQSHFTRVFRRTIGTTPAAYRRFHRAR